MYSSLSVFFSPTSLRITFIPIYSFRRYQATTRKNQRLNREKRRSVCVCYRLSREGVKSRMQCGNWMTTVEGASWLEQYLVNLYLNWEKVTVLQCAGTIEIDRIMQENLSGIDSSTYLLYYPDLSMLNNEFQSRWDCANKASKSNQFKSQYDELGWYFIIHCARIETELEIVLYVRFYENYVVWHLAKSKQIGIND